MLTDSIDRKHYGKTLGLASSFITGGILSGPAIAGTFLQWLGYWSAWAVPFALLAIDLVARFLMVDSPKSAIPTVSREADEAVHAEAIETTALLVNEDASTQQNNTGPIADSQLQTRGFYRVMLTQPAFLAGLLNVVAWSLVLSSFDATFPLHLRRVFNWGPAPIGLLFLGLQVPGIFLAPIAGWFRDRVGLRWPTTVGWLLLAPLFCLVGLPGSSIIPGLESGPRAEGVFVATIVCIGVVATLGRGAGTIQMTCELLYVMTARTLVDSNCLSHSPRASGKGAWSVWSSWWQLTTVCGRGGRIQHWTYDRASVGRSFVRNGWVSLVLILPG